MSLLRDIDRYLQVQALAEHPGTPPPEADAARARLAAMVQDNPDLPSKAMAVAQALRGPEEGPPGPTVPGWLGGISGWVQGTVQQGARVFADEVAGELSGKHRWEEIPPRKWRLKAHACAPGQVCIEVRVRAADIVRSRHRERILSRIEDELLALAEDEA